MSTTYHEQIVGDFQLLLVIYLEDTPIKLYAHDWRHLLAEMEACERAFLRKGLVISVVDTDLYDLAHELQVGFFWNTEEDEPMLFSERLKTASAMSGIDDVVFPLKVA